MKIKYSIFVLCVYTYYITNIVIFCFTERETTSLNEQCLMTAIENNQSRHLRLLLRLSITEGVHQMYEQYSTKKWTQVCVSTDTHYIQFEANIFICILFIQNELASSHVNLLYIN